MPQQPRAALERAGFVTENEVVLAETVEAALDESRGLIQMDVSPEPQSKT